jgi:hypothetical protein
MVGRVGIVGGFVQRGDACVISTVDNDDVVERRVVATRDAMSSSLLVSRVRAKGIVDPVELRDFLLKTSAPTRTSSRS